MLWCNSCSRMVMKARVLQRPVWRMPRTALLGLLTGIVCLLTPSWSYAARLALVIGNDNYQQIERLKNARNDAKLMGSVLEKAGFQVTSINDVNRTQFWQAIDRLKSRIQKSDEVVFYFAGHGVQIAANQLLLPTDITAQNESQVQRDGIPLVDVQDALKDARLALLLIDACRDNPFPKQGTRSVGGTRGLLPAEPGTGQVIMMSAGRNQKALDSVPDKNVSNGLFTYELAQVLQIPGLEIRMALEQVKDRVDDKAKQADHEQRPSLVSDLRGQFFLIAPNANINIHITPAPNTSTSMPSTTRPMSSSGLSLDDLEKEENTRKEWATWQQQMKSDHHKTTSFKGSLDLQAKAWERFLGTWAQNNPLSQEDEQLRQQAQAQLAHVRTQLQAEQSTAHQTANVPAAPVTGTVSPSATASTADTFVVGQTFRDCQDVHCPVMVVLPAGQFVMGSHERENEKPSRRVNVKQSFAIGKYEVTQAQWQAIMGQNPSQFSGCSDCPVERVSWNDVQQYVQKLSEKTGKQYRLPTEAEWEYACKAGHPQHTYCGGDNPDALGWHFNNSKTWAMGDRSPQSVGKKTPNAWGLHDMSGNVLEWVADPYHHNYVGAPTDARAWTSDGDGHTRLLRGGSWSGLPIEMRATGRSINSPTVRDNAVGLRLVRQALWTPQ